LDEKTKFYFIVDGAAFLSHGRFNLGSDHDEIDFLCMSPHQNLGGAESTGVLILKKEIYQIFITPKFQIGLAKEFVLGSEKSANF
jgi:selenocysteine lyase/cysteine desulfurase